jgi:hypothetical protein
MLKWLKHFNRIFLLNNLKSLYYEGLNVCLQRVFFYNFKYRLQRMSYRNHNFKYYSY